MFNYTLISGTKALGKTRKKKRPTTPSVPDTNSINMRGDRSCSGALLPPLQSCLVAGRLGPCSLGGIRHGGFGRGRDPWRSGSGWTRSSVELLVLGHLLCAGGFTWTF